MKLQTQIKIQEQEPKIDYSSKLVLLGSCFSENMGEKFKYFKFDTLQNPFGILFHPFAIENFLERVATQKEYTSAEVFQHQEIWSCFEAHSRLNALSETELLQNLNSSIKETFQFLKETSHVIVTLGTAWIYKNITEDKYVANCHKLPQKNFKKELASVSTIEKSLERSIQLIQQLNPEINFIFTVSPVRHAKDGFVENQRSKAHLIAALHSLIQQQKSIFYFPSYEIVMDELRDYRFYTEDLLHPNKTAINYIWNRFKETWLANEAFPVIREVHQIRQGLAHRPFNVKSEGHQKFQQKLHQDIARLKRQFPHFEF
jgi:lysophospholipase L1-like esterase